MAKLRGKHIFLIVCVVISVVFGLTSAALADMGGHKQLSDVCAAIAISFFVPVGFMWASVLWELS